MKKVYTYIFLAVVTVFGFSACNNLDLEPKGILDEGTLFNSEFGVKKYLAGLYNDLPIEDFLYKASNDGPIGYGTSNSNGARNNWWEALKSYGSTSCGETSGRHGNLSGAWGYWPYDKIRDVNVFINSLPDYAEYFTEQRYNELLAEGRFIRAFYYFGLVKRYGGVPIITEVQDPTAEMSELQLPRNTEYDCWKFIYDDLKFAMENGSKDKANTQRGNAYSAAALMAKTMLYAASVAKYNSYVGIVGPAVDDGLMGMDSTCAKEFFQYAYDACKFISAAGFKLHTGSDKEIAYTEVFIKELPGEEDIFTKHYGLPGTVAPHFTQLYHSYDDMVLPKGTNMAQGVGAAIMPTWELISLYEMPAVTDEEGYPIRFDSLTDIWANGAMEPRCRANFFFSGMTEQLSGTVLDIQAGLYKSYPGTAADGCPETNVETEYTQQYRIRGAKPGETTVLDGKEYKVNGAHGYATGTGDEGYTYMGTFVRKYVDYTAEPSTRNLNQSWHPYKVFRYGEILCDWAEAAYELGLETNNDALKAEAFEHVNELRDRAGAHRHEMVASPADVGSELYGFELDENLYYIRQERQRELCIENQTDWDYRRWRIAHDIFQNKMFHTLFGYYVVDEGKYIYLNEANPMGRELTYEKNYYYEQIPGGEINKNPNLRRNDGY